MRSTHGFSGHLILGLFLTLTACVSSTEDDPLPEPADCNDFSAIDIAGRWTITGTGKMSQCESLRSNGELEFEVRPLSIYARAEDDGDAVVTTDNEPDAFVQRIANSAVELSADEIEDFSFEGSGLACRISFTLKEDLPNGERMTFSFEGYIQNPRLISGRFYGRGPGSCRAIGTFEVDAE